MKNLLLSFFILSFITVSSNTSIYAQDVATHEEEAVDQNEGDDAQWTWVLDNKHMRFYYDPRTIETLTDGTIKMHVKSSLLDSSAEGRANLVKMLKQRGDDTATQYSNFSYSIFTYEFNCENRTFRQIRSTNYDLSGKILYDKSFDGDWLEAPSESLGEALLNIACNDN
jgi:hypothetical protein